MQAVTIYEDREHKCLSLYPELEIPLALLWAVVGFKIDNLFTYRSLQKYCYFKKKTSFPKEMGSTIIGGGLLEK